jgi:capsular polysaccharide biosynthesis protein
MQTIDYGGALRRNWILAMAVLAIALAVTAVITARQTPRYESSAQLVVTTAASTTDPADVVRALETLERRTVVATFARIPSSDDARTAVANALKLDPKTARRFRTHGSVVPNTNIIRIDAEGPDPRVVASMANAAAELTARDAEALYRVYSLRFLERATPARTPVHPDRQRNFLVGGALGLFLGVVAALAAERMRR